MTKTAVGKALILSLAMFVASGAAVSCTSSNPGKGGEESRVGGVGLNLVVSPGITVNTVNYTISGNGFSKTGTIDVTASSNPFTALITGIPAGSGYTIALNATASDGSVGTGSATFAVQARLVTVVAVVLRFTPQASTNGSVLVNGTTNVCPSLDSVVALPQTLAVGGTAQVTSIASDLDNQPSPLSYAWVVSPTGLGTLSSATVANPTFTAAAAGTATLTLTVSDGDAPCQSSQTTLAIAVTITGGGGSAGSGPATSGSGASGSGASGSGASGSGASGSGASGSGASGSGASGSGASGSGASGSGASGSGASGSGASGSGASGSGASGSGASGSGGPSTACLTCETSTHPDPTGGPDPLTSCPDGRTAGLALTGSTPVLAGIAESTGQTRAVAFQQILDCFHSTHCATTVDTDCFCGAGVDPNTCFSTGTFATATGLCKNIVAVGAESTVIGDINNHFFDIAYAIGAAATVIETCDQVSCAAECL